MSISLSSWVLASQSATTFDLDADAVVRLVVAAVLGAAVGIEREAADLPAGLRTHIAVASGAALFGIISTLGFAGFETVRAASNVNVDVARVASNVVVGIGFLGAGVVFRRGNVVHNLTTAASLWMVAAIGLACGVGNIGTALVATAVLLASLVFLRPLRDRISQRLTRTSREIEIRLVPGADPDAMLARLQEIGGVTLSDTAIEKEAGQILVCTSLDGRPDDVRRGIGTVSRSDEVERLRQL